MNSFIVDYRKTPTGQSDDRSDEDVVLQVGARISADPTLAAKYADAVADYGRLTTPAPVVADAPIEWNFPKSTTPEKPTGLGRKIADLGLSLAQGGQNAMESIGEIVPLVTNGRLAGGANPVQAVADVMGGAAAYVAEKVSGRDAGEEFMQMKPGADGNKSTVFKDAQSSQLKKQEAARSQAVADAGEDTTGFARQAAKGWAYVKESATNPNLLANTLAEQVAMMLPSSEAAGFIGNISKVLKLNPKTAETAAKWASRLAGSAMQGADVGNDVRNEAAAALKEMTEVQARNIPEIAAYLDGGMDLNAAKGQFAWDQAGKAGLLGGLASTVANLIPGVEDALARLRVPASFVEGKGLLKGAAMGALKEPGSELLEEGLGKAVGNQMMKAIDPSRSLLEGQGETLGAALSGAIGSGGVVGGLEGARSGQAPAAAATPATPARPSNPASPSAPTAQSTLTPEAKAAEMFYGNPAAAGVRLKALTSLAAPTKAEVVERDALLQLSGKPISQDPTVGGAAAPAVNSPAQKPTPAGSTPAPAVTSAVTPSKLTPEADALLAKVGAGGGFGGLTPEGLERIAKENGVDVTDQMTEDDIIEALSAQAVPVSPTVAAPAPAPVPLVAQPTASELTKRIKAANKIIDAVNRAVPGIDPGDELNEARTQFDGSLAAIQRIEAAAAELQNRSLVEAQQRATTLQSIQTERARKAFINKQEKQAKKNDAEAAKFEGKVKTTKAKAPVAPVVDVELTDAPADPVNQDITTNVSAQLALRNGPANGELEVVPGEVSIAENKRTAPSNRINYASIQDANLFNMAGVAAGFKDRVDAARAEGREISHDEAQVIADRFEMGLAAILETKKGKLKGKGKGTGISNRSNTSGGNLTRTAVALAMPDGQVVLAGLVTEDPKPLKPVFRGQVGTNANKRKGLRVQRMSNLKNGNKNFEVGGADPVLFRDVLLSNAKPIGLIYFDPKVEPDKIYQTFPSVEDYNRAVLYTLDAYPVDGDSANNAGGVSKNSGGASSNIGADGMAEIGNAALANRTAKPQDKIREEVASSWGDSEAMVMTLHRLLSLDSVKGKMESLRAYMDEVSQSGTARQKEGMASLGKWLGEVTTGLEGTDLSIERMFKGAKDEGQFIDLGKKVDAWRAGLADDTNVAPPVAVGNGGSTSLSTEVRTPAPLSEENVIVDKAKALAGVLYDLVVKDVAVTKDATGKKVTDPVALRLALEDAEAKLQIIERGKSIKPNAKVETGKGKLSWTTTMLKVTKNVDALRKRVAETPLMIEVKAEKTKIAGKKAPKPTKKEKLALDLYSAKGKAANAQAVVDMVERIGDPKITAEALQEKAKADAELSTEQTKTDLHDQAVRSALEIAIAWGKSAKGAAIHTLLAKNGGSMEKVRAALAKTTNQASTEMLGWIKMNTEGLDNPDSVIEAIYKKAKDSNDFRLLITNPESWFIAPVDPAPVAPPVAPAVEEAAPEAKVKAKKPSKKKAKVAAPVEVVEPTPAPAPVVTAPAVDMSVLTPEAYANIWILIGDADFDLDKALDSIPADVQAAMESVEAGSADIESAFAEAAELRRKGSYPSLAEAQQVVFAEALEMAVKGKGLRRPSGLSETVKTAAEAAEAVIESRMMAKGKVQKRGTGRAVYAFRESSESTTDRTANTRLAVERLNASFGGKVNVGRVAAGMLGDGIVGEVYSPHDVVIAMTDARFGTTDGLVTVIHEGVHGLFRQLPLSVREKIARSVSRGFGKMLDAATAASAKTGVAVATNFSRNTEEALVETIAQEVTAEGVVDGKSIAQSVFRWAKELYLRSATGLLNALGVTEGRVVDSLAQGWFENSLRRKLGGDFEWAFINVMDRFLPASPADRAAGLVNPDGTPGNIGGFLDPITGETVEPNDAAFRMEDPSLDLARQEAADRIDAASVNQIIPDLERAQKESAPTMDAKKFWKLVGIGEHPTAVRDQLETRTPGSSAAQLNGDGMTKAMNEQGASRALRRAKLLIKTLTGRISSREDRMNKATSTLMKQKEKTSKMEKDYRDAGVMESNFRDRLKSLTKEMLHSIDKGLAMSEDAGKLAEAIATTEGLLKGEAIPANYQAVLKSVMDGTLPVFDHLSAIAKLGLNLRSISLAEVQRSVKAAAATDARLAGLVANKPLFTALTALAHTSAREMGLMQLRQMGATTEHTAIVKELESIRTASVERLEQMWQESEKLSDQSTLAGRLRSEYLRERRALRRMEKTITDAAQENAVLRATQDIMQVRATELEKSVGSFSAWYPKNGAGWTAMKLGLTGQWSASDRVLAIDERDRVAGGDQVLQDLAENKRFLEENRELAGTKDYEQVKRQTYAISLLNMQRTGMAASRWFILDALFPDLGSKFKGTGAIGGEQIAQMMKKFGVIEKQNRATIEPLSHKWTAALRSLYDSAPEGFDNYNDFFKRVIVPVLYRIESEVGRDEAGALREAKAQAASLVSNPSAKFDANLEKFLRSTKTISEAMLKVAEDNGVFVADPRLGGQLRKAIGYGWMTVPRSFDASVVGAVVRDMAKAGWTLDHKESSKQDQSGNTTVSKIITGGTTFAEMDMQADDLGAQLESKFTPNIIEKFLEPFIRKPGKPVFSGIDSLVTEQAWVDSGGDVLAWIDLLGERAGKHDELRDASESSDYDPVAGWRQVMLNRIDSLYAMEQRMIARSSVTPNLFDPMAPKAHTLMDARLNDDIPPEHLTYAYFDGVQSSNRLGEIAFHAAFGRNGDAATAAIASIHGTVNERARVWEEITKLHKTKKARESAAKAAGYDYNTLARSVKDGQRVTEWTKTFAALFSPGGRAGIVDDLSLGQEVLQSNVILMLNNFGSGMWNLLSAVDFPLVFRGLGGTSRSAMIRSVKELTKNSFGSLLQDLGVNIIRASEHADTVGAMVDNRKLNSLEWGTRLADIGNRGSYADGDKGKRILRGFNAAINKGLTPGDMLRMGKAAEGDFSRFNLLTAPFKWFNDLVSTSSALANIQTFEVLVKKGMSMEADLADPTFKFTAEDLGMGGDGLFGDKAAFEFYRIKAVEYGLGSIEDVVRSSIERKKSGQPLLAREQAIALAVMAMNEVTLESSINTRPAEMFTNPAVRLMTPLMGWPIAKMNLVNQSLKTPEGQASKRAVIKGLQTMALVMLPIGVAFSLGMDEWDEQVRGKKSQLPEIGTEMTAWQNALGVAARLGKAGTYGLAGDLAYGVISPLDPQSGARQFTLDSRVLAYSQIKGVLDGLLAYPRQGGNLTWTGGGRQLAMALGANGPIQYIQIMNQMGLNISDEEAQVVRRQNVYASIRQAAVGAGISVRNGGGSATPTENTLWLREMQEAALSGDRLGFREHYLKALAAAAADGESDPAQKVRMDWRRRSPFRVLENPPSSLELQKIYSGMDDTNRRVVQESIRNYDLFTKTIELTPMEKKMKAKAPTDLLAKAEKARLARASAFSY